MDKIKKFLGSNIRRLRVSRGISQIELATKIKITPGNMNRIEHGKQAPENENLEAIASALNVEMWQLYKPGSQKFTQQKIFARMLSEKLKEIGWDGNYLAVAANLNKNVVDMALNGRAVSESDMLDIAKALKCPLTDLTTIHEEETLPSLESRLVNVIGRLITLNEHQLTSVLNVLEGLEFMNLKVKKNNASGES